MTARGNRFLLLFALANAGGVIAYVPLLTLLLPAKVAALAGEDAVAWLGVVSLAGAVAASLANIAFGWASDLMGSRRSWAGAGLCLTVGSYALVQVALSLPALVAAIIVYQVALNMLLAPLTAWAADMVPDRRKGLLGGLLGAGPLIGALAGVIATLPMLREPWMGMTATCLLLLLFAVPLLLFSSPARPDATAPRAIAPRRARSRTDFTLLWCARLLVQVAGNVLFGFLFYYFRTLRDAPSQAGVARLSALALLVAFPIALGSGALSDRLGRRKPFLVVSACAAAAGLGIMTSAVDFLPSAIGYGLFGCASAVFLSLHSGFAMQFLPSPTRRGRDLGVLNLTNTLPAIVAPLLALWLVPGRGFAGLLAVLAGLMLLASLCTLLVRHDAQAACDGRSEPADSY